MQINPTSCWRAQFNAVGAPITLHHVTQFAQNREDMRFVRRVEVDVEIAMQTSLFADQGIDTPPALEPISTADGFERLQNDQNLPERHVRKW